MKKYIQTIILASSLLAIISTCNAQTDNNNSNKGIMDKVNNLNSLHDNTKSLSVQQLFKGVEGVTKSLQIKKDGLLPEHLTKTEAVLICVSGEVVFENEKQEKHSIKAGEFYRIEPNIKHWVKGVQDSQLLLIK